MEELLRYMVNLFDGLSFPSRLLISIVILIVFQFAYMTCVTVLFKRIGVEPLNRTYLIETLWYLSFTTISILMVTKVTDDSPWDLFTVLEKWIEVLKNELNNCKIYEDVMLPGLGTAFLLNLSFSASDCLYFLSFKTFRDLEFLQRQLLMVILGLTYYSKCPLFGLTMQLVVHRCTLVELLSKFFYLMSQCIQSICLLLLAKALYGCYLAMWVGTLLYTIPVFLCQNKTIDSTMLKAEMRLLIILDILMWLYVVISVINSAFTRLTLSLTSVRLDRPHTLRYYLFGTDPWVNGMTRLLRRNETAVIPYQSENDETQRRLQSLIQYIHCSIRLRRRLRRVRTQLQKQNEVQEAANSQLANDQPPQEMQTSQTSQAQEPATHPSASRAQKPPTPQDT